MAKPGSKVCRDCNRRRKNEQYPPDKRTTDGRAAVCRECQAARVAGFRAAASSSAGGLDMPAFDGSAQWWIDGGAALARHVAARPNDRPLQAAAKTFAGLAASVRPFMQRAELEREVAELHRAVREFFRVADHGQSFASAESLRDIEFTGPDEASH